MTLHNINRWRIKHRYQLRIFCFMFAGVIIIVLSIFGAYVLLTGYLDNEGKVAAAQADTQRALDFVNGRAVEIEKAGNLATVYTVKKELVKLKEM